MKKLLFLLAALCLFASSFASFEISNLPKKATEIFLPIGSTGQKISLLHLSTISVKDYELLSGRQMKFFNRLVFKHYQKKIKNSIAKDGTINNKKLLKVIGDGDPTTGFHLGGFALGFLLPLIGILIAYLIGGDADIRRNRVKWALRGSILVISILSLVATLTKEN